jgi:oligopeptide/dipeptide ABC transporter ATP-binding protein
VTGLPVLRAVGITKSYPVHAPLLSRLGHRHERPTSLRALDGVDLDLHEGETLALVGESGSGKSTLAKILVGSIAPTSGALEYHGAPVPGRRTVEASRRIQMVFQDPYSSLNPRISVGSMLRELLLLHRTVPRRQVRHESLRLLRLVGLDEDALDAYPSQFSGGQRQRIAIARALAVRPDILIADEPVSALDVSVQATILDLFASLQRELGLSILFVAHNLAVVQHLSQRVAVMYLGRIVEVAPTAELFANPRHPYTRALIESIPRMTPGSLNNQVVLEGEPPSPFDVPAGCRFAPRCPFATAECGLVDPGLAPVGPDHVSACIRAGDLDPITTIAARPSSPAGPLTSTPRSSTT